MRLSAFLLVLCFVASGCDSGLNTSALEDTFNCDIDEIRDGDSERGTIEEGDCSADDFLGGEFENGEAEIRLDLYAFELDERSDFEIEAESLDFEPVLGLFDEDGDLIESLDEFFGNQRFVASGTLPAGLYVIAAASVDGTERGDYTLRYTTDVSEEDLRPEEVTPRAQKQPFLVAE